MNRRYFLSTVGAVAAVPALSKLTGLAGALLPADQLRNRERERPDADIQLGSE